jgi:hypothetical protein
MGMSKGIRKGTVVRLGRSTYRVTGNEMQDGQVIVRAVKISGPGRCGPIVFDIRELEA